MKFTPVFGFIWGGGGGGGLVKYTTISFLQELMRKRVLSELDFYQMLSAPRSEHSRTSSRYVQVPVCTLTCHTTLIARKWAKSTIVPQTISGLLETFNIMWSNSISITHPFHSLLALLHGHFCLLPKPEIVVMARSLLHPSLLESLWYSLTAAYFS